MLASASPRRKELLSKVVSDFEVLPSGIDELHHEISDPAERAMRISRDKAHEVLSLRPKALVIGADTIVAISDGGSSVHLEKPIDEADAKRMLRALSGREHLVVTGVALVSAHGERLFSDTTLVRFRDLGEEEIAAYVATGEPMDKAGAYAIQGGAADFVIEIEGSRDNVIGLPTEKLAARLRMPEA